MVMVESGVSRREFTIIVRESITLPANLSNYVVMVESRVSRRGVYYYCQGKYSPYRYLGPFGPVYHGLRV